MRYMHIPKTGGTAIKNAFVTNSKRAFDVPQTHNYCINNGTDWLIVLRDPWKRFCSAYWERQTNPQRKQLNQAAASQFKRSGYVDLTTSELQLFTDYPTPELLLGNIKDNPLSWTNLLQSSDGKILDQLFRPLSWYLGTVNQFKENEHRISAVINQENLTNIMLARFDIKMPTDPFLARNRNQFDIKQSYECSDSLLAFFKTLYADDYALVEYIKTRPYYIAE